MVKFLICFVFSFVIIVTGIEIYLHFYGNNNKPLQNVSNNNQEIEKKDFEESKIEEENKFLKVLLAIMKIISVVIAFIFIILNIIECITASNRKKLAINILVVIFQTSILLGSFFIKGKKVSLVTFIFQIFFLIGVAAFSILKDKEKIREMQ